jgi:hypothetical protein
MGVKNELDLLMGESKDKKDLAKAKKSLGSIQYT